MSESYKQFIAKEPSVEEWKALIARINRSVGPNFVISVALLEERFPRPGRIDWDGTACDTMQKIELPIPSYDSLKFAVIALKREMEQNIGKRQHLQLVARPRG